MKIAILTQPLGHNYGGIMQAWALQYLLKNMGHTVVTIDRRPKKINIFRYCSQILYRSIRNILGNGKGKGPALREHALALITQHTRKFIKKYITTSKQIYNTQDLKKHFIAENYDAVIVGSDQTWRPTYSPNIYNYFLDFITDEKIKKIAYASSFGVDEWEFDPEQTKICASLSKKFDFISVRETTGVKLCSEQLGVSAHATLDPTLLLTSDDYKKLITDNGITKNFSSGICTYFLDKSPNKLRLSQNISEILGLRIFNNQAECSLTEWHGDSLDNYILPPVTQWLSGFKDADFIVTDSFHGMVFSIIFDKPFLVISNPTRGAARFVSLLDQLDLKNNLITNEFTTISKEYLLDIINSKPKNLSELRNISLSLLKNSLINK